MAKAELIVTVPIAPLAAFNMMGGAMQAAGVPPFAQEGWSLKGQENVGFFKMGYPATVTGTVEDDGRGGSTIRLSGENFGIALNRVHVEKVLRKVAAGIQSAASAMPPMTVPPATFPAAPPETPSNETGLPPRVG